MGLLGFIAEAVGSAVCSDLGMNLLAEAISESAEWGFGKIKDAAERKKLYNSFEKCFEETEKKFNEAHPHLNFRNLLRDAINSSKPEDQSKKFGINKLLFINSLKKWSPKKFADYMLESVDSSFDSMIRSLSAELSVNGLSSAEINDFKLVLNVLRKSLLDSCIKNLELRDKLLIYTLKQSQSNVSYDTMQKLEELTSSVLYERPEKCIGCTSRKMKLNEEKTAFICESCGQANHIKTNNAKIFNNVIDARVREITSLIEREGEKTRAYMDALRKEEAIEAAKRDLDHEYYFEADEKYTELKRKYPDEPLVFWGSICARYGIKYVEDYDGSQKPTFTIPPASASTGELSIDTIDDDPDYKHILELLDGSDEIKFYKDQARLISELSDEWNREVKKLEPVDVFISFKSTENGEDSSIEEDTEDSKEARKIYDELSKSYKVFFSKESLEAGTKYEPQIFHALYTAKVLILYVSKAEYATSPWIHNECHRFFKRIENGAIPFEALKVVCAHKLNPKMLPSYITKKRQTLVIDELDEGALENITTPVRAMLPNAPAPAKKPKEAPKKPSVFAAMHKHLYKTVTVAASCFSKGYDEHSCDCGHVYKDNWKPLTDHTWSENLTSPATCTEEGFREFVCNYCGEKRRDALAAVGHSFGEWTETKIPTCTQSGEEGRQCSTCGAVEYREIKALGHSWETREEKTADPNTVVEVSFCKNCGEETRKPKTVKAPAVSTAPNVPSNSSVPTPTPANDDFVIKDGVLIKYTGKAEKVMIPNGVVFIKESAFENNDCIKEVLFSDSITDMGYNAFNNCANLTNVQIAKSSRLTSISNYAFYNCKKLASIDIPNSVKSIGFSAFAKCNSLTSITIPDSVTTIGKRAFFSCDSLTKVIFESENNWIVDGRPVIVSNPVSAATGLRFNKSAYNWTQEVQKKKSAQSISSTTTDDFVIENGVLIKYRGRKAKVVIPDGVITIGAEVFKERKLLQEVIIPDSVTKIGDGAFYKCENLTSITIPSNVTRIGIWAFSCCKSLTSVKFAENSKLSSIDYSAFFACDNLVDITIPDGVVSIGHIAFAACKNLKSITVGKNNAKYTSIDGNLYTKDGKTLIQYAIGKTNTSFVIPNGVTDIGSVAFKRCQSLTSITIPDSVKNIGNFAFEQCEKLTDISIPNHVTSIGLSAFNCCQSLTSITIPAGVKSIDRYAFANCDNLTDVFVKGKNKWKGGGMTLSSPSPKKMADTLKGFHSNLKWVRQ